MEPALASLSSLIGQVGLIGTGCLIALHLADRNVAEDELLAIVHIDSVSTLRRHLRNCEIHEYATKVQRVIKGSTFWHITDVGRHVIGTAISLLGLPSASTGSTATAQPRLIAAPDVLDVIGEKNFFSAPSSSSSSSDLIDQSDRSIDFEEEEEMPDEKNFSETAEAARVAAVTRWCDLQTVTGEKRKQLIADRWCTVERLSAWLSEMQHRSEIGAIKFRSRYGALNYTLTCCLNHDDPPDRFSEWREHQTVQVVAESIDESETDPIDEPAPPVQQPEPVDPPAPVAEKISDPPGPLSPAEFTTCLRAAIKTRNAEWHDYYGAYIEVNEIRADRLIVRITARDIDNIFEQARSVLLSLAQSIDAGITAIEYRH